MFKCIEVKTKEEKDKFLHFPQTLYSKNLLTQNLETESALLNKNHPLSNYFNIYPYIILSESEDVVARGVLTVYSNDSNGYVGLFESINNQECANCLLDIIKEKAIELGLTKLIGPLDCSFWIKYRFKTDNFENCYTGEPYNKEYYKELWENWGFNICEKYYSNQLRVPTQEDSQIKSKNRLEVMKSKGYTFRNTNHKTFKQDLKDIFKLMITSYSKFPMFKEIKEDEFVKMFKSLLYILDYNMVFLVHKNNELAGFFICFPNYGNLTTNLDIVKFFKILKIKNNPKEYVMLYMGAGKEHVGLGGSFAELAKTYLQEHNCTSIMALIHEGNVSGAYYKNLIEDKYNYVLMDYNLQV